MTTWAKLTRAPGWLAYSVRPDLWPPGWGDVYSPSSPAGADQLFADRVYLVYYGTDANAGSWYSRGQSRAVGDPGVAEALVLAGLVRYAPMSGWDRHTWVPCEEPT